jgi:hypothetical protein
LLFFDSCAEWLRFQQFLVQRYYGGFRHLTAASSGYDTDAAITDQTHAGACTRTQTCACTRTQTCACACTCTQTGACTGTSASAARHVGAVNRHQQW